MKHLADKIELAAIAGLIAAFLVTSCTSAPSAGAPLVDETASKPIVIICPDLHEHTPAQRAAYAREVKLLEQDGRFPTIAQYLIDYDAEHLQVRACHKVSAQP